MEVKDIMLTRPLDFVEYLKYYQHDRRLKIILKIIIEFEIVYHNYNICEEINLFS